jgi:hypothetical protein
MIEIKKIQSTRLIKRELDPTYSFIKKLQLNGTGSSKLIYLKGVSYFDELKKLNQDLDYVNFELFPKGVVVRYSKGNKKSGLILKRDQINQIEFESTRIKVRYKRGLKIVNEAKIIISLKTANITFYVPVSFYKSNKPFWTKDWLKHLTTYKQNSAKPKLDSNGLYLDILVSALKYS